MEKYKIQFNKKQAFILEHNKLFEGSKKNRFILYFFLVGYIFFISKQKKSLEWESEREKFFLIWKWNEIL